MNLKGRINVVPSCEVLLEIVSPAHSNDVYIIRVHRGSLTVRRPYQGTIHTRMGDVFSESKKSHTQQYT